MVGDKAEIKEVVGNFAPRPVSANQRLKAAFHCGAPNFTQIT